MAQVTTDTLGERLVILRRRAGLSQQAAAELAGSSMAALSRYEHDQTEPTVRVLAALARLYGVTPNELLAFEATRR